MSSRKCGLCKEAGHDRRTCLSKKEDAPTPPLGAAAGGGGSAVATLPLLPASPPCAGGVKTPADPADLDLAAPAATGRKCGLCKTPGHQATKCPRKEELEAKKQARRDKRDAKIQALWDSVPDRDTTLPLITDWKDPIFDKISWLVNTDPVKDGNMFSDDTGEIVPLSPEIANRPFPNDWNSTWRFICTTHFAPIPANKCSIQGLLMAIYIGNKYMMRRIGGGDHVFFEGFMGPGIVGIGS